MCFFLLFTCFFLSDSILLSMQECIVLSHSFNTLLSTLSRFAHFTLYLETASLHILAFTFQLILSCSLYEEGPFLISCLSLLSLIILKLPVTTCPSGSYLKEMNYNCISYPVYQYSYNYILFIVEYFTRYCLCICVTNNRGCRIIQEVWNTFHYNSTFQKFRQIDHVQANTLMKPLFNLSFFALSSCNFRQCTLFL